MKRKLLGQKKQLFTKRFFPAGNYTWTVPPGCTEVDVFLVGAGGGAGEVQSWGAMGGGGGGYTKTYKKDSTGWRDGDAIKVTPGQSIPIIVGKGVLRSNGGYSQFLNSSYKADGGNLGSYLNGGSGGSGGGSCPMSGTAYGIGGSDGSNGGTTGNSAGGAPGQGHTTRDFGEPTGKRNAGGGGSPGYGGPKPPGGASDYSDGIGQSSNEGRDGYTCGLPGGGYGGGAGAVVWNAHNASRGVAGGDGTVLIRYYAYRE